MKSLPALPFESRAGARGVIMMEQLGRSFLTKTSRNFRRSRQDCSQVLVSDEFQFCFTPIPKVASSSIKAWMLKIHGREYRGPWNDELHKTADRAFGHPLPSAARARTDGYYRFAFIRHPLERVVSAYLNKFVTHFHIARLESAQRILARYRRSESEGVSFREFVDYVCDCDPRCLDKHWQPQTLQMGDLEYCFIGKLERFADDFRKVNEALGCPSVPSHGNRSAYGREVSLERAADIRSGTLMHSDVMPPCEAFLRDGKVRRQLQFYYADDCELYRQVA